MGVFASQSPGIDDELLLVDSTPVECARSREMVKRSQPADAADYGYCASHSRFFWGFRLHALCSPHGTPRVIALTSPKIDGREVALKLLARAKRRDGETMIADKGYVGKEFATKAANSTPRSSDRGVDVSIGVGETVALLGPNGAGKSTTIDMILGLAEPDSAFSPS
jgi:ABC-type glutathione transport system ATPase component